MLRERPQKWQKRQKRKKEKGLGARGDATDPGTVAESRWSCRGRDPGKPSQTPPLSGISYPQSALECLEGLFHMAAIMGSCVDKQERALEPRAQAG